ncbi:MAG: HEPN domain-containing protein [Armatimonadia bacterium]
MSEPQARRELAQAWLDKATQDLSAAEVLNQDQEAFSEVILFHCQQAAEKALKAFLQWADVRPPRTHDLILLLGLCVDLKPQFEELAEPCQALQALAVDPRYPVEASDADFLPPDEATQHAHHVLDYVISALSG